MSADVMKDKALQHVVGAAFKEVSDFWRALFVRAGARPMLRVSTLLLAAGLSEGLTIVLLVPLLRAIDPTPRVEMGSSWLNSLFAGVALRPTLATALTMFVGG